MAERTNVLKTAFERVLSKVNEPSKPSYRDAWARWTAYEQRAPVLWNPTLVEEMNQKLMAEFKPATVRLTFTVAKRVWQEAQVLGAVPEEAPYPFRRLRIRMGGARGNVPEWNVMQRGEQAKLDAAMEHHPKDRAVVLCLVMQGWRVSELCRMQWEDLSVDPDGDTWATFIGKGGKAARVQVFPKTLGSIERWAGKRRTGTLVSKDARGSPLSRFEVNRMVNRWTKKVLGHRVTPHGLRATFISAVAAQFGAEEAQRQARHADSKTTGRYLRWATQKLKTELKF